MVLQFLLPKRILPLLHKTPVQEDAGFFFASHWGLMCFVVGGLVVYAAFNEMFRIPILLAAAIEKAGLIAIIVKNRENSFYKNMASTAVFDGLCVLVYFYYILTNI